MPKDKVQSREIRLIWNKSYLKQIKSIVFKSNSMHITWMLTRSCEHQCKTEGDHCGPKEKLSAWKHLGF